MPYLATVANVLIGMGYIPLVGAYVGYIRIKSAVENPDNLPLSTRIVLFVRGLLEILCLGIVFLIPDLLVSCHRFTCLPPLEEQPQPA